MAKKVKVFNPFYVLLVVAGLAFAITACGYGAMAVRMLDPLAAAAEERSDFVDFFDRHGVWLMGVELAVLAIFTVLAISTDGFWTRLAERRAGVDGDAAARESSPPA